jgi:hypothetical protein
LEEEQRCYAFDNSGLVKVNAIFDPHRPYQNFHIRNVFADEVPSKFLEVPA